MKITWETDVNSLLRLITVKEQAKIEIDKYKELIDLYCITPIVNEMAEDKGLGTYALNIAGQAPLCNKAMNILESFEDIKSSLDSLYTRIEETGRAQSAMEAEELRSAIDARLDEYVVPELETREEELSKKELLGGNYLALAKSYELTHVIPMRTTKQVLENKKAVIDSYQSQGILGKN